MVRFGIVTGREILKNRDGSHSVRMLQVRITDDRDIQSVQHVTLSGDDSGPPDDSQVIILDLGPAFKVAIAVDDLIEPSSTPGEKMIYSSEGGVIKAFIKLLTSGIIELNGNIDNAVRFAALDTQLQTLVGQINAILGTKADGSGTVGALILDLSPAKVDEVKLP